MVVLPELGVGWLEGTDGTTKAARSSAGANTSSPAFSCVRRGAVRLASGEGPGKMRSSGAAESQTFACSTEDQGGSAMQSGMSASFNLA